MLSHACKPDFAETEVELKLSNARKRIREENTFDSMVCREEYSPLYDFGYDLVTTLLDARVK